MKAKEYIAKYREVFESGDFDKMKIAATAMYVEFGQETVKIAEARGVKRNSALVAILKEQNIKWNVVAREFPGLFVKDGFKIQWLKDMPELNEIWR